MIEEKARKWGYLHYYLSGSGYAGATGYGYGNGEFTLWDDGSYEFDASSEMHKLRIEEFANYDSGGSGYGLGCNFAYTRST